MKKIEFVRQQEFHGAMFACECVAVFEEPDRSVGVSGGWFLDEAVIVKVDDAPVAKIVSFNRDEYQRVFGVGALREAEDQAAEEAYAAWERSYIDAHEKEEE